MPGTLTSAEALEVLRALYGAALDDDAYALTRLPGELDDNFLVEAADGARSILKIMEQGSGPERVEPQVAALAHLAREGVAGVPQVAPTTGGDPWTLLSEGPAAGRVVWRLTWLEGTLLADASPSLETFRALGARLAELDRALSGLACRGVPDRHTWDPAHPEWIADRLGPITDSDRREIIERVLDEVRARLIPQRALLRPGVIHADANDYNVLVDPTDSSRIAGIFDFGDMMETARVCEPAIAAAYAAMHAEEPAAAVIALFAGYHGVAPLDMEELEVAFTLVRARLAISVVFSAERAVERPDDAYVTVSEEGAWRVLAALDGAALDGTALDGTALEEADRAGSDGDDLRARLRAACPRPSEQVGSTPDLRSRRALGMGASLSLSYSEPIHAVRGWMQYLHDDTGRPFLDLYNNVPHVGHSHPHVAAAIARQSALLATNTRYLSGVRLSYIERLAGLFPDPLDTVFLVNSASEANELALRMVRTVTGRKDVVVQEGAYHGHTSALIDISPYKAEGPGGEGVPEWVHTVPIPDPYRGIHRGPESGQSYAEEVESCLTSAAAAGRPASALFAETFPSVGGQIVPPAGYLAGAAEAARRHGALVVADEVQTGFGRLGASLWGFELEGVVPDVVVLGKPMGNGFPIGGVVTTRAIADAFDTGMEFFSTFGGNPVACAAGDAMLDVLFDEGLQARAASLGDQLLGGLRSLQPRYPWMGDVRGMGLFIGVECVTDPETRAPNAVRARATVERLRAAGILTGTDGPDHNVVKLRGPLVLTDRNAERLVEAWDAVSMDGPAGEDPSSAA